LAADMDSCVDGSFCLYEFCVLLNSGRENYILIIVPNLFEARVYKKKSLKFAYGFTGIS
jgi:hypothetical protein